MAASKAFCVMVAIKLFVLGPYHAGACSLPCVVITQHSKTPKVYAVLITTESAVAVALHCHANDICHECKKEEEKSLLLLL